MLGHPLSWRKVPSVPRRSLEAQALVIRRVPPVLEKVQGKRAATDELAHKKRKTAGAAPHKPGGISLGGDQTTQAQSVAMSEWLDDNGALVAPPPNTEAPKCNTHVEVQPKGGEGVPEQ